MMTREEATEILRKRQRYCKVIADHANATVKADELREIEAIDIALSALRPITREQVEKVWPGCVVCKNAKYITGAVNAVAPRDVHHEIETDAEGDFDFCPVCGRPLTDEAVDMVMERLEEICK